MLRDDCQKFEMAHYLAFKYLVEERSFTLSAALKEIRGLSSIRAEGVAKGLNREEVLKLWDAWPWEVRLYTKFYTYKHLLPSLIDLRKLTRIKYHTLIYLVDEKKYSLEDAAKEIEKLNDHEMKEILNGLKKQNHLPESTFLARNSLIAEVRQKIKEEKQALKIVFVDIDGVLYGFQDEIKHYARVDSGKVRNIKSDPFIVKVIPDSILTGLGNHDLSAALAFNELALVKLRKLCDTHNAKIVISSAWRESKNLEQLKAIFSLWNLSEYIIDYTPVLTSTRGNEIENWLLNHHDKIRSFVILDDCKFDLTERFGERFIECNTLFSNEQLYLKASAILAKKLDYKNSLPKLNYQAIESNSPQVTEVSFNLEKSTVVKIVNGWDTQTYVKNLFNILVNNTQITHLTLHDFNDCNFLNKIIILLQNTLMKLQYLNIAHNKLHDILPLLLLLDGRKLHIPHICLNANPIEEQKYLAEWIKSYPSPLKIDLDLSGSGLGSYTIDKCIIEAVAASKHVSIYASEKVLPFRMQDEQITKLMANGKLKLRSTPQKVTAPPKCYSFIEEISLKKRKFEHQEANENLEIKVAYNRGA